MSNLQTSVASAPDPGGGDAMTALFANLVMQQSNLALMLLGKVAEPESGTVVRDLEAARMFIDQLEMLEAKTQGNLSKEEGAMLKQTLTHLRLAFVEAVEAPSPQTKAAPKAEPSRTETAQAAAPEKAGAVEGASAAAEEEHRKKFVKKY